MKKELLESLLKIQKELPLVKRNTDAYKYKYAPLEEVWDKVRDTIQKNGFFVAHEIQNEGVLSTAYHEHGELHSYIPFSKDALSPQDRGSEITYYKRYNLLALFNIQVEDEDDDAASASKKKVVKQATSKPVASTRPAATAKPQTTSQSATAGTAAKKQTPSLRQIEAVVKISKQIGQELTFTEVKEWTPKQASDYIGSKGNGGYYKNKPKQTVAVGDQEHEVEAEINPEDIDLDLDSVIDEMEKDAKKK